MRELIQRKNFHEMCVEDPFSQIRSHIIISILMKHRIMIQYSITVLIDCHIDLYRRSLVCAHAMYAHAHACICVCVDMFVCIYTHK